MKSLKNVFSVENTKKVVSSNAFKQLMLMGGIMLLACMPTFADTAKFEALDEWSGKILAVFSSTWVKALCLVALVIEAIAMVVAGQQGGGSQLIKKFAPWMIGTIILVSASSITSYFVGSINYTVSNFNTVPTTIPSTLSMEGIQGMV